MKRIYVSGPMSGIEDFNFPAFDAAAVRLIALGFEVENPASKGVVEGWTWEQYLRLDLRLLLDCDAVATLDGWVDSRGAWLEVSVARALGMPVRPLNDWLAA